MSYKLYNGDCLEVLRELPCDSIDITVTSPPYDDLRTYGGHSDSFNIDKFKQIADELYRVTKPGGVVVWIVADAIINGSKTGTSFRHALYFMECGFRLFDTLIWDKDSCGSIGALNRYENVFEYIFVLSKGKPKTVNLIKDKPNKHAKKRRSGGGMRNKDGTISPSSTANSIIKEFGRRHNIWRIRPCLSSKERTGHPAQFPERLIIDIMDTWSAPNDVVLDCFMGSGTTGAVSKTLNRDFIGIEINCEYYAMATARIQSA